VRRKTRIRLCFPVNAQIRFEKDLTDREHDLSPEFVDIEHNDRLCRDTARLIETGDNRSLENAIPGLGKLAESREDNSVYGRGQILQHLFVRELTRDAFELSRDTLAGK
jgi:hypothetical protein